MTINFLKGECIIQLIDNLQSEMTESKIVVNSPLLKNERLSEKYGCNIYLKREDLQVVRSFKIRGSFSKINKINDRNKQLICASAGNHAQGFAYICNKLNLKGKIFIPNTTPIQKIDRIHYFSNGSCEIEKYGNSFNETLNKALEYSQEHKLEFIHPYDDIDVIYGQGTIASEIYSNVEPDYIFSSIGGGGMISGVGIYSKNKNKDCKIIGFEPETCPSMKKSLEKNEIITIECKDNFVDGATVNKVGKLTFDFCKQFVDNIYEVPVGKICESMLDIYQNDGIIVEPAGALPLAGIDMIKENIKDKTIVIIISGGNNDVSRYPEVQERYMRYKKLKHYYIIEFKQQPGELKKFINILDSGDDIIRFEYLKKNNYEFGNVLIGIETNEKGNTKLLHKFKNQQFNFIQINENDLIYSYLI
jgi:threonine dehydratase